eukprot:399283-Rhodomonas_salina.10
MTSRIASSVFSRVSESNRRWAAFRRVVTVRASAAPTSLARTFPLPPNQSPFLDSTLSSQLSLLELRRSETPHNAWLARRMTTTGAIFAQCHAYRRACRVLRELLS